MNYIFEKIVVKTPEEFYQRVEMGYYFINITIDKSKEKNLFKFFETKLDSVVAQHCLANCYYYGKGGVSKDYYKAFYWWNKAAQRNYAPAQYQLGICYTWARGVNKDDSAAFYWYLNAANQGFVFAQGSLGYCYYIGEGVKEDHKMAVYWFTKAAEQGYGYSQYQLAVCYKNGQGVAKNHKIAYEWYLKAAKKGNIEAQKKVEEYKRKGYFD